MDEGQFKSPLDGILEEEPAKAQATSQNASTSNTNSNGRVGTESSSSVQPDDRIRRLRADHEQTWQQADVTAIQQQLKIMQSMILVLRSAVAASAIAAVFAVLKTRKVEKRLDALQKELHPSETKKVIEVEATAETS